MNYQENKNNHHMLLVYIILGVVFVATVVFAILMIRGYRWNIKASSHTVCYKLKLSRRELILK